MAALAVAYAGILSVLETRSDTARSVALGLVFGAAGAVAMHLPVELSPGLIFDARAVPLLLSGVFGGPWAAVAAGVVIGATRLIIGGAGAIPAMATVATLTCFSIALWYLRRRNPQFGANHLAVAGLLSILPIALGISLLGLETARSVLATMAIPLTITHTVGCYLVGWLLLAEDRRRLAEEQLKQARTAADQANEAKSQFLAQISHELRTPLSAILGSLDLLTMERLRPEHRDVVEVTRRSANDLLTLLNDLLDLSKIEAGRIAFEERPLDLRAFLDDQDTLYRKTAEAKGLDLKLRVAPDVPRYIQIDDHRLKQILGNLLSNALKFTAEGFVELQVEVGPVPNGHPRIRFVLRDTGMGIPTDRQDAVFEVFEQANARIDHDFGGTGLGLPISRKLARAMGGDITLESAENLGSCFSLELPFGAVDAATVEAGPAKPDANLTELVSTQPFAGRRVLLAEDVQASRAVIARMLESLGAEVVAVADGEQAVAEAAKGVDVVLMDMQMPVIDGPEATRRIRRLPGDAADTPIFALTADATQMNKRAYHAAGLDGVLTKPVDWGQLVSVVGCHIYSTTPCKPQPPSISEARPLQKAEDSISWNADIVASLEAALGRDAVIGLLRQLPVSIGTSLEDINAALAEEPVTLDRIRAAAHSLKGAAANLGFERLHMLAEQLEAAHEQKAAQAVAVRLEEELQQVRSLIEDYAQSSEDNPAISAVR